MSVRRVAIFVADDVDQLERLVNEWLETNDWPTGDVRITAGNGRVYAALGYYVPPAKNSGRP